MGCGRGLRAAPLGAALAEQGFAVNPPPRRIANLRFARKAKPCSAEVVDFVSNPPQLRASLSAHPAVTSPHPLIRKKERDVGSIFGE
jgi:hypothetical protein